MKNNSKGLGCFGFILLLAILYFLIVKWHWNIPFVQNFFKFEGQTAEEWYHACNQESVEKQQCLEEKQQYVDNQPSEEIMELDKCIKDTQDFSRELYNKNCRDDKTILTQKECLSLLLALGESLVQSKQRCVNEYLHK